MRPSARLGAFSWRLRLGLLAVAFWCGALSVCTPPLPALDSLDSSVTVSRSTLREWTESLQRADAYLTQAQSRLAGSQASLTALSGTLEQAGKRLSQLDAKLTLWQSHSAELETSLQGSRETLAELRETLDSLRAKYEALSQAFSNYRLGAERSRNVWRAVALGGVVATVLAIIVAAVR